MAGRHCESSLSAFSRHSTVPRMCLVQYCPSLSCAALIQAPDRLEATGKVVIPLVAGGLPRPFSVSAAFPMSSEWKARFTCSRLHFRPAALSSASRAATASTSPDTTACIGELTAASHSPLRLPAPTASNSSEDQSAMDNMAPTSANVSVDLARAETIANADSKVRKPPTTDAVYSPRECPAQATGFTPAARKTCASANSTTKSAGCNTEGLSNSSSLSPSPKSSGRRSRPSNPGAASISQH
mmetsp:Transcript_35845/g.64787  ORF Transcript_35845/g.64787 Transcript_35845/m.64787 type:complete len:242 (+) Transcript_35845:121-846(+)